MNYTLLATDDINQVALCVTKGHVYLKFTRPKTWFFKLRYPFLAEMLATVRNPKKLTLHLEPFPQFPDVSEELPFAVFVSVCGRVVFGCLPTTPAHADLEAIFRALPHLPMLVTESQVVANRSVYERVMHLERN